MILTRSSILLQSGDLTSTTLRNYASLLFLVTCRYGQARSRMLMLILRKHAPAEEVKHALLATLDIFMVCGTYAADLRGALESDWSDIEDYLIAHASKHIPAKYLITRDKELVGKSPIKAMSAQEFLDVLEHEYGLTYDESSLK